MKYTIEGFSQEAAMSFSHTEAVKTGTVTKVVTQYVDCTDLAILRWFVDFYKFMRKINIEGQEYALLTYQRLADDMPLVRVSKRSFADRLMKLSKMGILEHKHFKEGGSYSVYTFGPEYERLVDSSKREKKEQEEEPQKEPSAKIVGGGCLTDEGYAVKHRTNSNLLYNQLSLYNNIINNILSSTEKYPFDASLNETIKLWLEYKSEKHQTYQAKGMQMLITQILNKVAEYGEDAVRDVIMLSMSNNYTGITWEKIKKTEEPSQTPQEEQRVFEHEENYYKAAATLNKSILKRYPTMKPKTEEELQAWANEFYILEQQDHRTMEEISSVLRFARNDVFWRDKILDAKKFREKYDTLLAGQIENERKNK